jgi:hypothetical protein
MKKHSPRGGTSVLWKLIATGLMFMLTQFFVSHPLLAQPPTVPELQEQKAPEPATDSPEQYEKLAAEFRAHSYPILMNGTRLEGQGAEFLKGKVSNSQFVLLGEEHNVKQIPEFTSDLFLMLHECCGFNHLALENDPISAQMASSPPLRGNAARISEYATKYPNAFTFATRQELQLIADAGRVATTRTDPVWGLDQSFGVLHALNALSTLPGVNGKSSTLRELKEQAEKLDSERFTEDRHYMEMVKVSDLEKLKQELAPKPGSEGDFILSNLVSSSRIYTNYHNAHSGYASAFEREEQMKKLFLRGYRNAQKNGETQPKVLLKLGHWHIFRGMGPSALQTLGDFVTEFATSNDQQAFSIALFIHGSPNKWREVGEWKGMRPFGMAASSEHWTLIDFRPIREAAFAHEFGPLSPTMMRYIFGFDAALVIANGSPADEIPASVTVH